MKPRPSDPAPEFPCPALAAAPRTPRSHRLLAVALAGAVAAAGCGSTAGIRRTDGMVVEAEITGSDPNALYVRGESSGPVYRLDGRTVVDVDHPGNVAMVVGGLLLGELALMMTMRGFRNEVLDGARGDASMAARPLALMFGVPGAILFGHGLYRFTTSRRAAHDFERAFENREYPIPSAAPPPRLDEHPDAAKPTATLPGVPAVAAVPAPAIF
jgi:hypothetical protein